MGILPDSAQAQTCSERHAENPGLLSDGFHVLIQPGHDAAMIREIVGIEGPTSSARKVVETAGRGSRSTISIRSRTRGNAGLPCVSLQIRLVRVYPEMIDFSRIHSRSGGGSFGTYFDQPEQKRGKGVGVWGREPGPLVPPPGWLRGTGEKLDPQIE